MADDSDVPTQVIRYYNRVVSEMPNPKPEYYLRPDARRLEQAQEIYERSEAEEIGWKRLITSAFAKLKFARAPTLGIILRNWRSYLQHYWITLGEVGLDRLDQVVELDTSPVSPGFEIVKRRLARMRQWERCRDRTELTGGWVQESPVCQECPIADGCRSDSVSVRRGVSEKDRSPRSGGG